MSTNFPSGLDSYATKVDNVDSVLAAHINDPQDAIEALQAKLGVDGSAVTSSHDYKLRNLPAQDQNWTVGASRTVTAQRFVSTQTTGTSPFGVSSTTVVTNLNADQVDGLNASDFVRKSGTVTETITGAKTFSEATIFSNTVTHNGGVILAGSATAEYIKLNQQSSAPSTASNQMALYGKDVSGNSEVFIRNESSGAEIQVTNQGALYNAPIFAPTNIQMFTSSGTWTRPVGVNKVYVKVWGAGGGGQTPFSIGGATPQGTSGAGGGYAEGSIEVTGNVTVTVGTGGLGGGGAQGAGTNGGTSSFAGSTTIQATGGQGAPTSGTGVGGIGSGGSINLQGLPGKPNSGNSNTSADVSGGSAAVPLYNGSIGGTDGGQGSGVGPGGKGAPGYGGGGGGGGSKSNSGSAGAGGDGEDGLVIVYY